MKNLLIFTVIAGSSFVYAQTDPSCRGCASGKLMLQCDYYLVKEGKMDKRSACEEYAKIVDVDGASAKAAWYYLLAGKPEKAYDAARRAIDLGQVYANEYMAYALLIQGKDADAKKAMQLFHSAVKENSFFKTDMKILHKLYPKVDFGILAK